VNNLNTIIGGVDIDLGPLLRDKAATDLRREIDSLLSEINTHEHGLEGKRMKLGARLREVEVSGKWKEWGFEKFSRYVVYVCEKINKQKSQVYAFLQVATDLLPYSTEEQLEQIGITKAQELRRFVKQGRDPRVKFEFEFNEDVVPQSTTLLGLAAIPGVTAAILRTEINKLLHQEEQPKGLWFDLGGCYFTTDEKQTWLRAVELGKQQAEVQRESSDHEQLRAALTLMAQEVIGSWEPETV
jgi:hypothetical protein